MKISFNWLNEFIDHGLTPQQLADLLTMSGSEVKSIEKKGQEFDKIVVGEIIQIDPHPQADKLQLPVVNVGQAGIDQGFSTTIQVVCGAPNIKVGQKIAFAFEGARVFFDPEQKKREILKKAKIRGVESRGMVCSERELGFGKKHQQGILELDPNLEVGLPLAQALNLEDTILELEITPNRGDCLSILGIAREVAACTQKKLKNISTWQNKAQQWFLDHQSTQSDIQINMENPKTAPHYALMDIHELKIQPSPLWLRMRLNYLGVRSINNVVDITNYLMLELGQPQHAFDKEEITGSSITIRKSQKGEKITTLDGQNRQLTSDDLIIADSQKPLALAGIMGGISSEVQEKTTKILLEAAHFESIQIRKSSKNHNLRTEGSSRWEKYVDPEGIILSLWRNWQLLQQMADNPKLIGLSSYNLPTNPNPRVAFPLPIMKKMEQLLGQTIPRKKAIKIIKGLGFSAKEDPQDKNSIIIRHASWRPDVLDEADFVEEIIRIVGFSSISPQIPPMKFSFDKSYGRFNYNIKKDLKDLGYIEAYSYSMIGQKLLESLEISTSKFLKIANPLADFEYMRTSHFPNLLQTVKKNSSYYDEQKYFEIGKVFWPSKNPDKLPQEPLTLGAIVHSNSAQINSPLWQEDEQSLFYLKQILQTIQKQLKIELSLTMQKPSNIIEKKWLHPSRQTTIFYQNKEIGWLAELHPYKIRNWGIEKGRIAYLEITIDSLPLINSGQKNFNPFSIYPSSRFDVSWIVDQHVKAAEVEKTLDDLNLKYLQKYELIDLYHFDENDTRKKSMTWRLSYQSEDKTLSEKDVDKVHSKVLKAMEKKFHATIRID